VVVTQHAVGWGEGSSALVAPVKAIWVGVGFYKNRQDRSCISWGYTQGQKKD